MEELKRSNLCPFFVELGGYNLVFTDKHYLAKQRKAHAERS